MTTIKNYDEIKANARKAAIAAHIKGKTPRAVILDPVVIYTCETEKEKAHEFSATASARDCFTEEQRETVKKHVAAVADRIALVALELRKTDGQPKTHRAEMIKHLKAIANVLELGVGAVNKDAALLVEWCTSASTDGKQTNTKVARDVWRHIQKLFTNKLNAYEARMKVGQTFVTAPTTSENPATSDEPAATSDETAATSETANVA